MLRRQNLRPHQRWFSVCGEIPGTSWRIDTIGPAEKYCGAQNVNGTSARRCAPCNCGCCLPAQPRSSGDEPAPAVTVTTPGCRRALCPIDLRAPSSRPPHAAPGNVTRPCKPELRQRPQPRPCQPCRRWSQHHRRHHRRPLLHPRYRRCQTGYLPHPRRLCRKPEKPLPNRLSRQPPQKPRRLTRLA